LRCIQIRPSDEWMGMGDLSFDRATRDYVLAVVRRIIRCTALAEDVTQEALLCAFKHRASFRGEAHPRTWLYRVAMNAALGRLRSERRFAGRIALDGSTHEVADTTEPADIVLCRSRRARHAQKLIAELPPRYRKVMELRRDHSEPETARRLGLSLINVKVIAHRARAKLRAAMA
jgi:RNA polymerase sigma-70 factor (ECF subfamily)